jgi:hypothetical protein
MATNGSKTVEIFSWISMKFSWEQASQSVANNTTTINWRLELFTTTGALYRYNRAWKVNIDGTEYSGYVDVDLDEYDSQVCASGTSVISHNSDGTKTFAYSFTHDFSLTLNSGKYMGTYSGSGSDVLTTIPRKSTLSASNGTLGTQQLMSVLKEAPSFTHTITYTCGSASGTICTKKSETNVYWTPPNDLAYQAPSGQSVSVTLTLTTYNGNTAVGTPHTVAISCAIPYTSTFDPVLMPTITDAMDYSSTFGGYIQGQSKLRASIETYGSYGAWIDSVRTEFEGATYPGTDVTTNVIKGSGSMKVKVIATDSRGRHSVSEATISVLAYQPPKITSLTATRCNADGTANASGSYIKASFSATISALNNKNTAVYYVGYKKTTDANHTAVEQTGLKGKYSVNSSYIFSADTAYAYTVIFTAADAFGQARTTTTGSSVRKVMSFLKKNNEVVGIAVGKEAVYEGFFDVGLKVRFSGGGDTVVEQGESGGWVYRKWDSGVAECWKTLTHNTAITTAWGALYHGTATSRQSYPFNFVGKPVEQATLTAGSYQAILFPEKEGNGVNGASASACYNVCRPSSIATSMEFYISLYVVGKWK